MKRLPMRKIREALRLRADGFSGRQVAQSLAVGRATISEYFRRADVEGLRWPLPADLSDAELERRLFPYSRGEARRAVPQPDWAYVHAELRRKGVTLSLLWEEYRGVHPDGYGYSRYCELYTSWEGKLSPVMRQRHPAGERLFVDYAGQTVDRRRRSADLPGCCLQRPRTGESARRCAQLAARRSPSRSTRPRSGAS